MKRIWNDRTRQERRTEEQDPTRLLGGGGWGGGCTRGRLIDTRSQPRRQGPLPEFEGARAGCAATAGRQVHLFRHAE